MTPGHWVEWILLSLGVAIQVVSVAGLLAMPNLFDRLHYLAPASGLGTLLIAGAVAAREALDHQGIEALLIAGFLLVFAPVLTHATARAARIREHGDWRVQDEERVKGP